MICPSPVGVSIHLHGPEPLRPWINRLGVAEKFQGRGSAWLSGLEEDGRDRGLQISSFLTVAAPWGDGFRTVRVSALERALFEVLKDVPGRVSFERAERSMESLADLSPRRLELLLRRTRSIKIKRLFFWLAERHGHPWARRLDPDHYDLGHGKRVLAKDGRLVSRYGITVPRAMHG